MEGKNLLINSKTGSGKTVAYALPALQKLLCKTKIGKNKLNLENNIYVIILVPTDELVSQTVEVIESLIKHCNNLISIYGINNELVEIDIRK